MFCSYGRALLAAERGKGIGLTAAELVQRTFVEARGWLDRIESAAQGGQLDSESLHRFIGAWEKVIGVARQAFRLDEPSALTPMLNLTRINVTPASERDPNVKVIDVPYDYE